MGLVVVSLSPFLVGAVSRIRGMGAGDISGDQALIALDVREVGSHMVLLGPYSRFFWHHPGPLYFYLLALPSALFGDRTLGAVLGVALLNAVAAAGIVTVAVRRGGWALGVWSALLLGVYLVALGPATFDLWNPSATLLAFALVLMLSWTVACADEWAIPWLVFVASFCIQTHVGLAPGVVTACVTTAATLVIRRHHRSTQQKRALRRALLVGAVVGVVAWLPPIIEELTSADGNLTRLATFFSRSGSQHSLWDGVTQTAFQVTLLPRALTQHADLTDLLAHSTFGSELVLSALAFLVATVLALRMREHELVVVISLIAVELVVAVSSVTRVVGGIEYHLVEWISAIGLVLWIACGGAAIAWVRSRRPGGTRSTVVRIGAAIALACAVVSIAVRGGSEVTVSAHSSADPPLHRLVDQILTSSPRAQPLELELRSESAWPAFAGAVLELEQRGAEVEIERSPVTALLFQPDSLTDARRPSRLVFVEATGAGRASQAGRVVARYRRWLVERAGDDDQAG